MPSDLRGVFARQVQSLYHLGAVGGLTDGELLEHFLDRPGEAAEVAFAAIVERHGAMVLQVCRSILRDDHAAEDAFQATFLVLVRRASSVRNRDSLASWLYGSALRVAACSRAEAARRISRERIAAELRAGVVDPNPPDLELSSALHGELARLPERYRAAVVLCYLEGRSCEEAARELGWPVGTVKSRLSRGRDRLRDRLSRLGLQPTASILLPPLRSSQVGSIARLAGSKFSAVGLSPAVSTLVRGALKTMLIEKIGMLSTLACLTLALGLGLREIGPRATAQDPSPPKVAAPRPAVAPAKPATFLTGTVLGPDDKPAAGAEVFLVDGHLRYLASGATPGFVPGKTLRLPEKVVRGKARTGLDGRYRLEVTGSSLGENVRMLLWTYCPGDKLAWVEVAPGAVEAGEPIDVRLEAGTKTQVTVIGPDEQPAPGVRVVPTNVMKGRISIPEALWDRVGRTTDADGIAVLDALESNGVSAVRTFSERFGMQQWGYGLIDAGPDRKRVKLVEAGSLSGRVIGADGKPLPGTKLFFATLADGLSGPYTGVVELATDADGKFAIPAIPCGKLFVRFPSADPAVPDDYLPDATLRVEAGVANRIEIDRSKALRTRSRLAEQDRR